MDLLIALGLIIAIEGFFVTEKIITQIVYSSFFKIKKCVLMKIQKYNGNIVLERKFEHGDIIDSNIKYTEETAILKPLIEEIEKHTSQENLALLYNNIKTLKLQYKKKLIGATGVYYDCNNSISYSKEAVSSMHSFSNILGHELYHVASRYAKEIKPNIIEIIIGFRQKNIFKIEINFGKIIGKIKIHNDIGLSLNEGYTELNTLRTFPGNKISYKQQVKIVRLIELFFDNPQDMENLYFSADLSGLIKQLELFASKKEITNLLIDFDNSLKISELVNGTYSNIIPWLINVKIQLKLYDWFTKNCHDINKLLAFEDILFEDKNIKYLINAKNILSFENNLKNKQKRK